MFSGGKFEKFRFFIAIIILFLSGEILCNSAQAETLHTFASWSAVFLQGNISSPWGYYFESQTRLYEYVPSSNRLMIRFGPRYSISKDFLVFLGFAWLPTFTPHRTETRLWEQALYNQTFSNLFLTYRLRFEQRWLQYTSETAFRLRIMPRAIYYFIPEKKLGAVIWDEYFYNINSVARGPQAGFDQNRFFVGLNYRIDEHVQFEPGYLNVLQNASGSQPETVSHVWVAYVNIFT